MALETPEQTITWVLAEHWWDVNGCYCGHRDHDPITAPGSQNRHVAAEVWAALAPHVDAARQQGRDDALAPFRAARVRALVRARFHRMRDDWPRTR